MFYELFLCCLLVGLIRAWKVPSTDLKLADGIKPEKHYLDSTGSQRRNRHFYPELYYSELGRSSRIVSNAHRLIPSFQLTTNSS